jgi:GNAT superfamily N-acetyltransferase
LEPGSGNLGVSERIEGVQHPSSPSGLRPPPRITLEPFDSEDVRWVVAQAEAELVARYRFLGEHELSLSTDEFAPPLGVFVVARRAGSAHPVGGVGIRPVAAGIGEIKRLWVEEGERRLGTGGALMARVEVAAGDLGYRTLRLETGPKQPEAVAMYRGSGWTHQTEDWDGEGCIPDYSIRFAKELPGGSQPGG